MPESGDPAARGTRPIHTSSETNRRHDMPPSKITFERQMELADRLLNDPDVPLEPHKVWAIVEQLREVSAAEER